MNLPRAPNRLMPAPFARWDAVDAVRGLAMVWMTFFHFCFDLNYFGYIRQNFYDDPLWTWQRTGILSLFLATAGLGQAIAVNQGQNWGKFWRRWGQVAGCAALVTVGSYAMYPKSFIYFGTLHGMAVTLILLRLAAIWGQGRGLGSPGSWWWLGGLLIAFKFIAVDAMAASNYADWVAMFNSPQLNWLGLITVKPVTEDYVPLLPWLGVMCWGYAGGQWLLLNRPGWLAWQPSASSKITRQGFDGLALLGRWSLLYYLLHQPVMIGALAAWKWCAG